MRPSVKLAVAGTLLVVVALLLAGCPNKSPSTTAPTTPTPSAKAPAAPAKAGAEQSAGTWKWDPKSPKVDPLGIPEQAASGMMEGKPFETKFALVKEEPKEKRWLVRFFDTAPEAGKETDWWGPDKCRYVELTLTKAAKGEKYEIPYGSEKWSLDKNLWMYYQTPRADSPNGTSVNPGKDVALYLEFTDFTTAKPAEGSETIGSAKGKVAMGSQMSENEICFIAGTFDAKILKP